MSYIGPKPSELVLEPIEPATIPIPTKLGGSSVRSRKSILNLLHFRPRNESTILLHLTEAAKHFDLKEWKRAADSYSAAQALNPIEPLIYFFRAIARFRNKDFPGAIRDYTEVIRRSHLPQLQTDAMHGRSASWGEQGQWGQALEDLTRALKKDPQNLSFLFARMMVWIHTRASANALDDAATILKEDPSAALRLAARLEPLYLERWLANTSSQRESTHIKMELNGVNASSLESLFVVVSLLHQQGHKGEALSYLTPAIMKIYQTNTKFSKPTIAFLTGLLDHLPTELRNHPAFLAFLKLRSP